jgi:hypothetical protein
MHEPLVLGHTKRLHRLFHRNERGLSLSRSLSLSMHTTHDDMTPALLPKP